MSETKYKLELSEVIDKLQSKGLGKPCVCGSALGWTIPTELSPEGKELVVHGALIKMETADSQSAGSLDTYSFIMMLCKNCGNTRLVHPESLMSEEKQ